MSTIKQIKKPKLRRQEAELVSRIAKSSSLKMEALCSSETSDDFHQTTLKTGIFRFESVRLNKNDDI
jgi:hypothetical protein